jgi:hypothetical protein
MFKPFKPNIGRFKVPGSKFNVNLLSVVSNIQAVQIGELFQKFQWFQNVPNIQIGIWNKVEGFKSPERLEPPW